MPAPLIFTPIPPFGPLWTTGSGKFGTPCERMQRPIASACDLALAVWAAVRGLPCGRYDWHDFIADLNAGPFTWTPFTDVLFGVCWI